VLIAIKGNARCRCALEAEQKVRPRRHITICASGPGFAQPLAVLPASPGYNFSTPMPPGVAAPGTVESR